MTPQLGQKSPFLPIQAENVYFDTKTYRKLNHKSHLRYLFDKALI